jgi:hypothetical protein
VLAHKASPQPSIPLTKIAIRYAQSSFTTPKSYNLNCQVHAVHKLGLTAVDATSWLPACCWMWGMDVLFYNDVLSSQKAILLDSIVVFRAAQGSPRFCGYTCALPRLGRTSPVGLVEKSVGIASRHYRPEQFNDQGDVASTVIVGRRRMGSSAEVGSGETRRVSIGKRMRGFGRHYQHTRRVVLAAIEEHHQ